MDGFSFVVSVRIRPPGVLSSASATCGKKMQGKRNVNAFNIRVGHKNKVQYPVYYL
jgi:hypothetical protein